MKLGRWMDTLPVLAFALFCALMVVGSLAAVRERSAWERHQAEARSIRVTAPVGLPRLGQESIELAMVLFSIDKPTQVVGPRFERDLEDRGLTSGGTAGTRKTVSIGASAFTSWGVLGSTLAHEVEVHARQSFLAVVLRDRLAEAHLSARRRIGRFMPIFRPSGREEFENDGTWRAEREAYMYELANASRFGLTEAETRSVSYVMNYYYPEPGKGAGTVDVDAALEERGQPSQTTERTTEVKTSEL